MEDVDAFYCLLSMLVGGLAGVSSSLASRLLGAVEDKTASKRAWLTGALICILLFAALKAMQEEMDSGMVIWVWSLSLVPLIIIGAIIHFTEKAVKKYEKARRESAAGRSPAP